MMKKRVLHIFVCFLVLCTFSFKAYSASFVAGFEDLPLMKGLSQKGEEPLSFDTPSGRIVESYAQSHKKERAEILSFYDTTLPQLGWKRLSKSKGKASFSREGEELVISVDAGVQPSVHFELTTVGTAGKE